ncbi:MAG: hypothetical protein K2Q12_08000 [Rickettsiales bacterium]|nr:hypothetical protein [Rickettsiales bacterium]
MARIARSDEVIDEILNRITNGESVRKICTGEDMPNPRTWLRWCDDDAELAARCARAREHQAEVMDGRIMEVVEGVLDKTIEPDVARVALSGLQWRASKLAPKRYGAKLDVEGEVKLSAREMLAAIMEGQNHG